MKKRIYLTLVIATLLACTVDWPVQASVGGTAVKTGSKVVMKTAAKASKGLFASCFAKEASSAAHEGEAAVKAAEHGAESVGAKAVEEGVGGVKTTNDGFVNENPYTVESELKDMGKEGKDIMDGYDKAGRKVVDCPDCLGKGLQLYRNEKSEVHVRTCPKCLGTRKTVRSN